MRSSEMLFPSLDAFQEHYFTLLESLPQLVWVTGTDGVPEYVNRQWTDYTGCDLSKTLALGSSYFLCPEDREPIVALWHLLLQTGESCDTEIRLRSREGQWRWMQARAIPMQAASGEVVRFLWICTDIDDRKRVDTERKRAEEYHSRLAAIVESSQDAIVSKDLDGIVTSWNAGATLLYGYTPDEIIGRSKSLLIPPDRQEELAMILDRMRSGDRIAPYETVRLRKDGSRVDVSLSVSPVVDSSGQVTGASTIARSITERLQAEAEKAQHLVEIETLNAQLRRAMTETHHRVRNSLQIISALVDLEAPEPDASVGVEQFLRIGRHVRALAAVHDLLTEQAKLDSDASDLSSRDLLRKLVELIRRMAGDRRIEAQVGEARLSIQQGSSLAVITHELMTNAVRFGRSVVEVRFHVHGDSATLEVLDDGPGFPVGFDPVESGNTGLELISQIALWDLRASEVRFDRQPQGGGRVTLSFPLTHTPGRTIPPHAPNETSPV